MAGQLLDYSTNDFRSPAVVASDALLRSKGEAARNEPENAGVSYCLMQAGNPEGLIWRLKATCIVALAMLPLGLFGGVIWRALLQAPAPPGMSDAFAVVFLLGWLFLFVPTLSEGWRSRAYIRKWVGDLWTVPGLEPVQVSIENAFTYSTLKLLAEDVGYVVCHPESHCVQIEGITCRYLIYPADVVRLSLHMNRKTVLIGYRIGDVELNLAVIPRRIRTELRRQLTGRSTGLFDEICGALGVTPTN